MANANGTQTAPKLEPLGKGIQFEVRGTKLHLVIDLTGDHGPSSSGKTTIVATTGGNQLVAGVKVGVNVFR